MADDRVGQYRQDARGALIGTVVVAPLDSHARSNSSHFIGAVGPKPHSIGNFDLGATVFEDGSDAAVGVPEAGATGWRSQQDGSAVVCEHGREALCGGCG